MRNLCKMNYLFREKRLSRTLSRRIFRRDVLCSYAYLPPILRLSVERDIAWIYATANLSPRILLFFNTRGTHVRGLRVSSFRVSSRRTIRLARSLNFRKNLHRAERGDDLVKYACILWIWIHTPGKRETRRGSLDAARNAGLAVAEYPTHACITDFPIRLLLFFFRIEFTRPALSSYLSYAAKIRVLGPDHVSSILISLDVEFLKRKKYMCATWLIFSEIHFFSHSR